MHAWTTPGNSARNLDFGVRRVSVRTHSERQRLLAQPLLFLLVACVIVRGLFNWPQFAHPRRGDLHVAIGNSSIAAFDLIIGPPLRQMRIGPFEGSNRSRLARRFYANPDASICLSPRALTRVVVASASPPQASSRSPNRCRAKHWAGRALLPLSESRRRIVRSARRA